MAARSSAAMVLNALPRAQTMPYNDNVWGRRTSILPSLSWKKSSEIEIVLDGEEQFIHSYSSFDEVSGRVNLRFEKDTCIDDLTICLQGQTTTWVEKVATTSPTMGRTTGKHTFLRVQQPIEQNYLPEYNKAVAGQQYTIPFKFVIPDRILDFTCNHKVDQDDVRDNHLQLPPSLGDPMLSGVGNTLMDDLAPNMTRIIYTIRVALLKASPNLRKPELIQQEMGIRIVPAREELPPLSVDLMPNPRPGTRPNHYSLRKEKNVRKGIFKIGKKQGRITAQSLQPTSLKLHHPSNTSDEAVTTTTTVQLRFDPASEEEQPPPLGSLSSKLKVFTFFGAAPWHHLPTPDGYDIWSTVHSQYPHTVDLSTLNLSSVEWVKHDNSSSSATASRTNSTSLPNVSEKHASKCFSNSTSNSYSIGTQGSPSMVDNPLLRRESTLSIDSANSSDTSNRGNNSSSSTSSNLDLSHSSSVPSPSEAYNPSIPYYTASIIVPITLPIASSSTPCTSRTNSTSTSPNTSRRPSLATSIHSAGTMKSHTKLKKPIIFIPTFHSCLISRIYTIELAVHAQSAPTLNLRLPVQISLPYTDTTNRNPSVTGSEVQQAWFDPFGDDQEDIANDEALARALAQTDLDRQHGRLGDVPEYETLGISTDAAAARRASMPLLNARLQQQQQQPVEAPPEYHSSIRRASAARRSAANAAAAGNSAGASASSRGDNAADERRGSAGGKGSVRRRFSLLL